MQSKGVLDVHVHLVGKGDGGTGCRMAPFMQRSFTYTSLIRMLGLRGVENLDAAIVARLGEWTAAAGSGAAVLLAQDAVRNDRGEPVWEQTQFYTPNDYVARVCREHPGMLFGAYVHPSRRDALLEMDRCAEMGAVLLKLHPVLHGIDLGRREYREYYRHAAQIGMPILVHTGVINALFPRKRHWGDPARLKPILDEGATVIAAHAGRPTPLCPSDYLPTQRRMMEAYPNLYTDDAALSQAFAINTLRYILRDPFWLSRLCHGSDFPVPPVPDPVTSGLPLGACWRLLRDRNPLRRDILIKRGLGCPDEVFERGWTLLRKAP